MTALDLISHVTATVEPVSRTQIVETMLRVIHAVMPHADKIIPTQEDDHIEIYVQYKQQTAWLRYWHSGTSEYIEAWGNMAEPVSLFEKRHAALAMTSPAILAKEFLTPAAQALATYLKKKTATATVEPAGENVARVQLVRKRTSEALAPLGLQWRASLWAGPEDIGGWFDSDCLSTSLMAVEIEFWDETAATYSCKITCGGMGAGPKYRNVKFSVLLKWILKTLKPVKTELDTAVKAAPDQKDFVKRVREILRLCMVPPNYVSIAACNAYWRTNRG